MEGKEKTVKITIEIEGQEPKSIETNALVMAYMQKDANVASSILSGRLINLVYLSKSIEARLTETINENEEE